MSDDVFGRERRAWVGGVGGRMGWDDCSPGGLRFVLVVKSLGSITVAVDSGSREFAMIYVGTAVYEIKCVRTVVHYCSSEEGKTRI